MDTVFIESLEADALIGAYAFERHAPQKVLVDLSIGFDFSNAIQSDALSDTLNYDALIQSLRNLIKNTHYKLLESLANDICRHCIEQFGALNVQIRICKPDIIQGTSQVGIQISRNADDYQ